MRRAAARYQPRALLPTPRGKQYLWLLADGRGRITRTALSSTPPRSEMLRDQVLERFPGADTDAWGREVPEALYPYAGYSRFLPGEVGPDTVVVMWAERPTAVGAAATAPHGPFLLGRAIAQQLTPAVVREAARRADPDQTVWFVQGDGGEVLGVGTFAGGRDYEAIRAMLQPRFPGQTLFCSAGFALPGASGPVLTVRVRAQDAAASSPRSGGR